MELRFPADWGAERAWRGHGLRGVSYGPIAPELAGALPRWIAAGSVTDGEVLKPGSVFRCDELVVKFFPRPRSLADRLREAPAVRSARRYFRLLPVPSPRPLLALRGLAGRTSLLVSEFAQGPLLSEVWGRDAEACRALSGFMARMHAAKLLHGDLHPANLIWNEGRWVLLDVDGLRHALHFPGRVIERQWARLICSLKDEPGLERVHRDYAKLIEKQDSAEVAWQAILRRAQRMASERQAKSGVDPSA